MNKYFKQNLKRRVNLPVYLGFENRSQEGGKEAIDITWNELKEELSKGNLKSNDLKSLKDNTFIRIFIEIINDKNIKELVNKELKYYSKKKNFFRAAKIKEEKELTFDRFIPNSSKMREANRFSPKDKEWLYLAFDKYINDVKNCCYKEIRACKDDNISYCEFEYDSEKNLNVLDLSIADDKDWDTISLKIAKKNNPEKTAREFFLETYLKLLSEELFVPIEDTDDRDIEYAPFHCIANILKDIGYDGIIYKSTVSKTGKNIVMFDKESFIPKKII